MLLRTVFQRCSTARHATKAVQQLALIPSSTTSRSYHSFEHPSSRSPFTDTENKLLAAAYKHVPSHGFTRMAMGQGAKDAGFNDMSPSIFNDGPFSLIEYHLYTQRNALASRSRELQLTKVIGNSGKEVEEKAARLTWERLLANKAIIHRWQEALAIMMQPSHASQSLKELALLSDEIWYLAGDKSVNTSWYTKRASLSMIYSTTELFMTNDESPGFAETHKFLYRKFSEAQGAAGILGSIGQWAGFTVNAGVNVLRSKGVQI